MKFRKVTPQIKFFSQCDVTVMYLLIPDYLLPDPSRFLGLTQVILKIKKMFEDRLISLELKQILKRHLGIVYTYKEI